MKHDTINKLFLELSQVATAKTARELELEARIKRAAEDCYKLCLQIEKSGASPELTECSILASSLHDQLR